LIGPQDRLQNQNSTSYTTRHEYQEGFHAPAVNARAAQA
jgi:hypothetical protein